MTFESNILNIYGAEGEKWLKNLPQTTRNISAKMHLSELTPVSNLSYNYVLSGLRDGMPIILKLGFNTADLKKEVDALNLFAKFGAVKVLAEEDGLILLQRCIPGSSLKTHVSLKPNEILEIACRIMKRLHKATIHAGHHFPHVKDWIAALEKEWDLPIYYLQKARQLSKRLLQKSTEEALLHGDLHYDNILKNGRAWVVIDPKGLIGPPIFETWALILNIENDTQFIADFFNFDLQDVRDWYFIRLILVLCWHPKNNISSTLFMDLAEKAYPLTSP